MNDFSQLEAELKQLRPRSASPELAARIEAALVSEATSTPAAGVLPRPRKFQFSWVTLGFSAAALAAVVLLARVALGPFPQTRPATIAAAPSTSPGFNRATAGRSFLPDGLTRVVYDTRDEGLLFPRTADAPVRRKRSRARETLQWKEAGTGASLRVSYPTEEIELIPVAGQ